MRKIVHLVGLSQVYVSRCTVQRMYSYLKHVSVSSDIIRTFLRMIQSMLL
jgi:hypothetical protein